MYSKIISFFLSVKTSFLIYIFRKKLSFIHLFGKKVSFSKFNDNVLVVIAHVVEPNLNDEIISIKLLRLINCLEGLLDALAAYNLNIVLLSKRDYELINLLPKHLRDVIDVYYSSQNDPMKVEYDAVDVFSKYLNKYDYYLFIEDDIILKDPWIIEKQKEFLKHFKNNKYVLVPHRYEYYYGKKFYIDQEVFYNHVSEKFSYSQISILKYKNGVKFCIYENPHSAFYMLNNDQLVIWLKSGYLWKNKNIAYGYLESAATFCMHENFIFYKSHPSTPSYFEVQHFGNKYINQYINTSV